MIDKIFKGKIASFVYGIIISFMIAWGIINVIYKENVQRLEKQLNSLKQQHFSLIDSNTTNILDTNKSQQETIKTLFEKIKLLENSLANTKKQLQKNQNNSAKNISLNPKASYKVKNNDFTLLVKKLAVLINEFNTSFGLSAKFIEYRVLMFELKTLLPNDFTIKNITFVDTSLPKINNFYYDQTKNELRASVQTQLFMIFTHLDKYKRISD